MDEWGEAKSSSQKECVQVAVNIRPLIASELLLGCRDCITVVPGEPQVQIGAHCFTFDHVYGSSAIPSIHIFEECVAPLIDAIFHGYNATVLAYGQTGSGKTYTMGTNFNGESNSGGIIPLVMNSIFKKAGEMKKDTEFLIRVSFIEIFKEEVFDLLDTHANATLRNDNNSSLAKPSRPPIQIRETVNGGITLAGVTEAEVTSKEEMKLYLMRGSQSRATGSTNMNSQSSRSHAIFTICLEQKRYADCSRDGFVSNDFGDDILHAKLHLVDLAGSERAKRTGADGMRLKEGIHINKGLLALGNVINALGDEKKRKDGGHIPYRDSKLTRLLQDSLGGNSKTVMIACISPADANAEETINTLKYANRAKNIQNKAVINRDPASIEMQKLRSQLEQLQSEVLFYRGNSAPFEELQVLRKRITLLEASNAELHQELKERQITCDHLSKSALDAQVEKDKLILKIESARNGKSWDEIDCVENTQNLDLLIGYASRIQELETELVRAQNSCNPSQSGFMDCLGLEKEQFFPNLHGLECIPDGRTIESSEAEYDEKEREHSSLQDRLDKELHELDKRLELKEAEMKRFAKVDTSVLRQHYEKKLMELEHEKRDLQNEIEELRFNLANISSTSGDTAQKLKEEYLHKLTMLESQVTELKKKQEAQSQLLRQKQKSDESAKRLQEEIQKIKSQKVQLQQKIKQESEQFRSWKASREKEVLQLKKEGRRNEYEMHKLLALNQRQKMVLQRKTEEASMATKRLKELLEAKKASSRESSGIGHINSSGIQALMQAIEDELEVTVKVYEVRLEYERQMKERATMGKELARLKEESEIARQKILSDCPQTMSPSARNSRIATLENMLATSSSTLVLMASELSEAEEHDRVFSGRGRWNQIRSVAEAKTMLNHLFNLASLSRCQLWKKEVICREKDFLISEFKENIYRLNSLVRQLEAEKATQNETDIKIPQKFIVLNNGRESCGEEDADMDTSDSEDMLDMESDESDEDWVESGKVTIKRRSRGKKYNVEDENKVSENDGRFCCSCSKNSTCKTKKCECRHISKPCSSQCGCNASKCANREDSFSSLDDEKTMELVSQGTLLLQSALGEKPKIDCCSLQQRKPLSDIGNAQVDPKASKPKKRKNWGKSTIQLVAEPIESVAPQPNEVPDRDDIILRLPRSMETISLESHQPFIDRSSHRNDESANKNKENSGAVVVPLRTDEKESRIL
ncbi:kinesin-like protein KIN-4C [Dendrobium catenatum]|uniref:Kinesin-like protein FLA10 n=1 Tax=Dendrobium catenatum TaxID=906689 RepID=A0A2I0VNF3_9ASPA|nr:kinesin-like protein KIN-4C [Dendrobium catenatum]PKU64923.1 Kinesin-like protein FLA10 [Dendrobium catenatum]